MCGILGYVGYEQAAPFLLAGLSKLEYRGYDSAGIAVLDQSTINVKKSKGRIHNLMDLTKQGTQLKGTIGIGHTRWATHGEPSDNNAHPHLSYSKKFAVVHNGIIENYMSLKDMLINQGINFQSETDTEVIAHLLDYNYNNSKNVLDAITTTVNSLEGSYALGILFKDAPDKIFAVKKGSPLIIGKGKNENFIASDVTAILSKTKDIYRLDDNEMAIITNSYIKIMNNTGQVINKKLSHVDWDVTSAEKSGYEHFMLKEIMEQPQALQNTINPRIKDSKIVFDDIIFTKEQIQALDRIYIVACGSAYHVGVAAKYIIETLTRIPVEVDLASEFRYRNPIVNNKTLVILISQSGETADTLAALREAKKYYARVISIVNVIGSSIACESDDVLYTCAGPEIAVATTKAYSTQLAMIYMLGIYMAEKINTISQEQYNNYIKELSLLPSKIKDILKNKEKIKQLASIYHKKDSAFFIGRGLDYAVCLEGSLKLKEISYIHSDAYAAGELKHGTISLIEKNTPVIAILTVKELHDKMISNIKEVKARGADILVLTTENNQTIKNVADNIIFIPDTSGIFLPSLAVVPLQLFSYYVSLLRGCNIDKPRNLAKSVTVE